MPHRIASRLFQEMSVFLYIPLGPLGMALIDATTITQIISAIIGIIVAVYAIRFYHAQTKKSEVERQVAELERDILRKKLRINKKTKPDDDE